MSSCHTFPLPTSYIRQEFEDFPARKSSQLLQSGDHEDQKDKILIYNKLRESAGKHMGRYSLVKFRLIRSSPAKTW